MNVNFPSRVNIFVRAEGGEDNLLEDVHVKSGRHHRMVRISRQAALGKLNIFSLTLSISIQVSLKSDTDDDDDDDNTAAAAATVAAIVQVHDIAETQIGRALRTEGAGEYRREGWLRGNGGGLGGKRREEGDRGKEKRRR
ncbi:LOW QUALITY PROTEIN: hypothetical protein PoB_005705700 [Plakobranchus ocellatus]|uniref:Uncharacterized protein n=1 Tax=Plakobranchus ocellatus TaxID=259542 RepID=A0AAV4CG31_9GAST|nr:LOW QUALITY PROTEIN: hypothetical protein PoB_005705700 [Plakobranchus ocellatus]